MVFVVSSELYHTEERKAILESRRLPYQMIRWTSSGSGRLAAWVGSRTCLNLLDLLSRNLAEIGGNVEWMVAAMDFKAVNQATNMST